MLATAETFQLLAQVLPFGVCVMSVDGRVVFWNQRAAEITGYFGHEVLGRQCREDLLVEYEAEGGVSSVPDGLLLMNALRQGGPSENHLFVRHKRGHRIPVVVQAIPLRNEHGTMIGVAEIFHEENVLFGGMCWITREELRSDNSLGIPSFTTSREQLELSLEQQPLHLGVFMVEVQNLKAFARTRGKDMVAAVLRAVAQTLARAIHVPHFLGAWSHGRFLVLAPNCDDDLNDSISRKLSTLANACAITWWGDEVVPEVKIRSTILRDSDSVVSVMSRLECWPEPGVLTEKG